MLKFFQKINLKKSVAPSIMAKKAKKVNIRKLIYQAPIRDGKEVYCPIVVKDKNFLTTFLKGFYFAKDVAEQLFEVTIKIPLPLDSTRFNDILLDGRRLQDLSDTELDNHLKEQVATKENVMNDQPNDIIVEDSLLHIDCPTCNIPYNWFSDEEIPDKNFNCPSCGSLLIHYTHHDDSEFIYDGE